MGVGVISDNTTIKVSRVITSTTTVTADCFVEADYTYTSDDAGSGLGGNVEFRPIKRTFVGGQTVPTTITTKIKDGAATYTITYTLQSGVEFINSP